MQLLYRINRSGTTVVMATHDREMVDRMRRRVIALDRGRLVRDEPARRVRRGMSLRFRFFVGEALRSLRNNLATTLAATMTVLIVMFWLGVFVALGSYMYSKIEEVRQDVKVRVFLAEDASPTQIGVDPEPARAPTPP